LLRKVGGLDGEEMKEGFHALTVIKDEGKIRVLNSHNYDRGQGLLGVPAELVELMKSVFR